MLPTVLVDGRVAGVWNVGPGGIEIGALGPIDADSWEVLDHEARQLLEALGDRDCNIGGRTASWWPKLPISSTHTVAL